jgi:hypothetical protein
MFIGPFTAYRFILLIWAVMLLVAAAVWAMRDAIRDMRFRWRMRKHRIAKGWRPGKCLRCGYDIRANESCCSECGQPIVALRPPPRKLLSRRI